MGEISEEIHHEELWEGGEDESERDETLVEPEFPGLWSQDCDLHKVNPCVMLWEQTAENKPSSSYRSWEAEFDLKRSRQRLARY